MFHFETFIFAFYTKCVILRLGRESMPETRNPAIEKLVRWIISRATRLMTDAVRWEIVIAGKGNDFSCKYTVYEDP